jgi:hypothetical protein
MSYVSKRTITKIAQSAAFCVLLAILVSPPVQAQLKSSTPTGSHLRVPPKTLSIQQVRTLQHDFAVCVVKQNHALASQYVLDRDGALFPTKYRGLLDPDCLFKSDAVAASADAVGMEMNDPRLALADALIAAESGQITADRVASATSPKAMTVDPVLYQPKPGAKPEILAELQKSQAEVEARIRLYKFGECVVRKNPADANQLVRSEINSADEKAAFQALMPAFSDCLDKGVEITFSEEVLRGVVAYNFYVLGHQPPAPQTAASNQR